MRELIWVDGWQMQCCGDAFEVGSRVSWRVGEPDREVIETIYGDGLSSSITGYEDHHVLSDDDAREVAGKVLSIRAGYFMWGRDPDQSDGPLHPVAGTGELVDRKKTVRWEPDDDDPGSMGFGGYVVEVETT